MGYTIAEKIIKEHLLSGEMTKGTPIGLKIDQTLTQDATGTMAYLQLEALDCLLYTSGKRVIAVGTTSCRTLEAVSTAYGKLVPAEGYTDIFIYPGYEFKAVSYTHLPAGDCHCESMCGQRGAVGAAGRAHSLGRGGRVAGHSAKVE